MTEETEWPGRHLSILQWTFNLAHDIGPQLAWWPQDDDPATPKAKQVRRNLCMAMTTRALVDFYNKFQRRQEKGIEKQFDV